MRQTTKHLSIASKPTSQKKQAIRYSIEHRNQLPVFYVIFAALAALLGYGFILAFPAMFIASIYNAFVLLPFYPVSGNLSETLLWITLSIFFGHISYNILNINFATIKGLKVKCNSAVRLFQILDEISADYPRPKIHQIVVTEKYELKLVKIPHFGIPIITHNTLVIGLPLMLTSSPDQFKCLLTREIIHYSKRWRKITNWLNQLRDSWDRYRIVLKQRACIGHQLLYGFFTLYSPVYNSITLPIRIADELNADRNALDLLNSDELISALQAQLIGHIYYKHYFQPETAHLSSPFDHLQRIAKTAFSQSNSDSWLQKYNLSSHITDECYPTLQQRMENLGLTSVNLPPDLKQSAAEFYFQHYLAMMIKLLDDNWQNRRCNPSTLRPTSHSGKRLLTGAVKNAGDSHSQSTA